MQNSGAAQKLVKPEAPTSNAKEPPTVIASNAAASQIDIPTWLEGFKRRSKRE